MNLRRRGHRLVRGGLQGDGLPAPPGLVLGDEHLAAHVDHPAGERVGREAAEHDRVRGAETRACEHGDRELRDHSHVDRDGGALPHAELLQRIRHPDDVALEVGVGDRPRVARLAFPVVGDPLAEPRIDVAVDAVVRDVEAAAEEPLRIGELPLGQRVEVLEPGHARPRLRLPEAVRVGVVDRGLRVRLSRERRIGREPPLFVEQGVDRLTAHRAVSTTVSRGSRSYGNRVSVSQPSSVTRTRSSRRTPPKPCR